MIEPPAVTLPGPVLVISRSADAVTVVSAVSVLLEGSGSDVVDVTVPVFVSEAPCPGASTTMVKVVAEPVFQLARAQVTEMLPVLLQVQPPLDALTLTNVTPAGRVSVTVTFAASEGPLLETATV